MTRHHTATARRTKKKPRPVSPCHAGGHAYGPEGTPTGARLSYRTCTRCGATLLVAPRPR